MFWAVFGLDPCRSCSWRPTGGTFSNLCPTTPSTPCLKRVIGAVAFLSTSIWMKGLANERGPFLWSVPKHPLELKLLSATLKLTRLLGWGPWMMLQTAWVGPNSIAQRVAPTSPGSCFTAIPKKNYSKKFEPVYHGMLQLLAEECCSLMQSGVTINGTTYYPICMGLKGDAPALAKAGYFCRYFATMGKNKGCCHECLAGARWLWVWECFPNSLMDSHHWFGSSVEAPTCQSFEPHPWGCLYTRAVLQEGPIPCFQAVVGGLLHFQLHCGSWMWPWFVCWTSTIYCCGQHFGRCLHGLWVLREAWVEREKHQPHQGLHEGNPSLPKGWIRTLQLASRAPIACCFCVGWGILCWMARWMRTFCYDLVWTWRNLQMTWFRPRSTRKFWKEVWVQFNFFTSSTPKVCGLRHQWLKKLLLHARISVQHTLHLQRFASSKAGYGFVWSRVLHHFHHFAIEIQLLLSKSVRMIYSPASHLCEADEDFVGRICRGSRMVHAQSMTQRTLDRYLVKLWFEHKW